MRLPISLIAAVLLIAGPVLANEVDPNRAREAAEKIASSNAFDQYCSEDGPAFPGYSDDETAAACDIIANSEED